MRKYFTALALFVALISVAQFQTTIGYPTIAKTPFARLVNVKGFYNSEDNGWVESHNSTNRMDAFKEYEIRTVKIDRVEYFMLSKLCSDKQNFFVIEKSDFKKINISEDEAVCTKLPIKYYGSVKYVGDAVPFESLETELMNRIVYHDNLQEAMNRFEYAFCINTYYEHALNKVKFYTCLEQKSIVDEYISLKNCAYRKSYTDIFISPELFKERYLEVDKDVFTNFWQMSVPDGQ